jgi:hypothetical protein
MTFFKFEGNWKTRSSAACSIKFEFGFATAVLLAVLHLLLG